MNIKISIILIVIIITGCTNIPKESVTLNKNISAGIKSIHESNIRFVEQYFELKLSEINLYEKDAMDDFFNKIAAAASVTDAPPIGAKDLFRIKQKIEDIHSIGQEYRLELLKSKNKIIDKLNSNYNTLSSANNSITGLLQSAIDVDDAIQDGLTNVKEYTNGKIDLTEIDKKVNYYLSTIGSKAGKANGLFNSIKEVLDSSKGDK